MLDFLALTFFFFFPLSSPAAAFLCSCPFTSVLLSPREIRSSCPSLPWGKGSSPLGALCFPGEVSGNPKFWVLCPRSPNSWDSSPKHHWLQGRR